MNKQKNVLFRLKRPTLVYIIAVGFLIAPFINLALPLFFGGHETWYNPTVWLALFLKLPMIEEILLLSTILAGGLLFYQRKSSWFAAVIILLSISAYNIFFSDAQSTTGALGLFNLIVNGCVLVVFYFFRFPYLDKRDHVFAGYSERFQVSLDVTINGKFEAQMLNLSSTGCFLKVLAPEFAARINEKLQLTIKKNAGPSLSGIVVRVNGGLGVKFSGLNSDQSRFIEELKKIS